ncbi:Diaminopimelate decarboxylase [Saliniradius amylolyticus]|uniref:Diaminopimelate decarboxylase n=1 Tax=Saliniradius amylolyticus TaxID=2183582 RepID=A0A2S2E762_9ALTE|nr:diaminopimelate decarboxylase [Saliniradius amylolyticus]AWL13372.1 Diaminopimelate decarboxylase [Saliniradius amylolyticus]
MDYFQYQQQRLYAENVPVTDITDQYGTPCYIYSRSTIERHWKAFDEALGEQPHLVCYAVKANSNLGVLSVMAKLGSGFDIVSGGELARVIEAGGDPARVVFSGVAKTEAEIAFALEQGIKCFNVESPSELKRINRVAGSMSVTAPISIRVNPDVDAKTHPYISTGLKANKFGIDWEQSLDIYRQAAGMAHLTVVGMDCHIGSQLTDVAPFVDALERLLGLIDQLKAEGIEIDHLDVGGGLGVTYQDEKPPLPADYVKAVVERLQKDHAYLSLIMEPGRAIMANAGIMATKVEFIKQGSEKNFALVDAGMNDMLRPSLYSAWMDIVEVDRSLERETRMYDVVGPVCETGDFIGKDRSLSIDEGDLLVQRSAGAYGFTMASNYNSRCRPAEIMVDKDQVYLVRERESLPDLWKGEHKLP